MGRIRTIKPDFFKDEGLADLSPKARLLFIGLWCEADREGRVEDRPRRIKAEIFPYDNGDVDELLQSLSAAGFIERYVSHGIPCIQIKNFLRHQIPSRDEAQSELPSPEGKVEVYVKPPNETIRARLYQRDNYVCAYCGLDMKDKVRARTLDHVIPQSKGGGNEETNLVTACKKCHQLKSDRTPEDAGMNHPIGLGLKRSFVPFVSFDGGVNGGLTVADNKGTGTGTGTGTELKPFVRSAKKLPTEPSPMPEELTKILPMLKRVTLEDPGTLFGVWKVAFPDVGIVKCILACDAWAVAGNVRRTPRGWARTLNTWLGKEQDRTSPKRGESTNGNARLGAPPVPGKYAHLSA